MDAILGKNPVCLWLFLIALAVVTMAAAPASKPTTDDQIRKLVFDRPDRGGNSFPQMIDPPLWRDTRYLLEGESHVRMLALLDDLLSQDVERTMPDTRRRALLQHELWQVFDWTMKNDSVDPAARIKLRKKLAAAIRRVALTQQQVESLPSSFSRADGNDAPPNLADANEGWVCLGIPGSTAVAEAHLKGFGGRSAFGVFLRHPDGAQAALAYLRRLAAAPYPPATQPSDSSSYAFDAAPHFPVGTQLALLRRMMLIDREGQLICSPIVESIQVRTYLKIEPVLMPEHVREQEFDFDKGRYLAGEKSALRAVGPEDRAPPVFETHDMELFEGFGENEANIPFPYRPPGIVLRSCIGCHRDPGVLSMNSYTRSFSPVPAKNPGLVDSSFEREVTITAYWKRQQASWGMLRGYREATEK